MRSAAGRRWAVVAGACFALHRAVDRFTKYQIKGRPPLAALQCTNVE
jgi:hypothetical protein